jgi:hypothetical protein
MYELDFNSPDCTMNDVIARSIVCHPSLFVDAARHAARTHAEYAEETGSFNSARIARDMAKRLYAMANEVDRHDLCISRMSHCLQASMRAPQRHGRHCGTRLTLSH